MADWERRDGFDLSGKRALVVGTATPAGPAIGLAMAEAGADVAFASATLDGDEIMAAKRAEKKVKALGRASLSHGWDVTLPTNVQVGLKQIIRDFGHPTILVFNADMPLVKPLEKTTDTDLGRILQTNLAGAFYAARSFTKELPEGETGRLIYVTGIIGDRGTTSSAAYAAARSGVLGLTRSLAQELGPRGVTVNAIAGGWMDWTEGRGGDDPGENLLLRFLPMRRFGTAEELGPLGVLLASEATGFINGAIIRVDGGVSQHL